MVCHIELMMVINHVDGGQLADFQLLRNRYSQNTL